MVPEGESTVVREAWQQVTGAGGREITSSTTIMKYEEWTGSGANYKLSAHPKWCTSSSGTPPPKGSITSQTVPPTGHCVQIPEPMRTLLTPTPRTPCIPLSAFGPQHPILDSLYKSNQIQKGTTCTKPWQKWTWVSHEEAFTRKCSKLQPNTEIRTRTASLLDKNTCPACFVSPVQANSPQ